MTLYDLIQNTGLVDAAAITTVLNTKTVVVRNENRWTLNELFAKFGETAVETLINKLKNSAKPMANTVLTALSGTGVRFDTDEMQTWITNIAATDSWSNPLRNGVLALGKYNISPYEAWAGEGQVVTQQSVQDAIDAHVPVVFDDQQMLLSVNLTPSKVAMSLRVVECKLVDGKLVTGQSLGTISSGDVENADLPAPYAAFVASVLAALRTLKETF
jgi:hypothetical protein